MTEEQKSLCTFAESLFSLAKGKMDELSVDCMRGDVNAITALLDKIEKELESK